MSNNERKLIIKIIFWLIVSSLLVKNLKLKHYIRLFTGKIPFTKDNIQTQTVFISVLKRYVYRLSKLFPFRITCLAQSLVAKKILRDKGIPSILYLGVKKEYNQINAHAWLRVNNTIITGEIYSINDYHIINTIT